MTEQRRMISDNKHGVVKTRASLYNTDENTDFKSVFLLVDKKCL